MRQPKISVICLTRNRPQFLKRSVEIFFEQDWANKELLIMEHSDAGQVVELPRDPRVKRVLFPKGTGSIFDRLPCAMNKAQGDLVCFWDDDDWSHPKRLSTQAEPIVAGRAAMTGLPISSIPTLRVADRTWWRLTKVHSRRPSNPVHGPNASLPGIPACDGTIMLDRKLFLGPADPALKLAKVQFLQKLRTRNRRFERLLHAWIYVYVRHGSNTFPHDDSWKYTPIEPPNHVPKKQLDFWDSLQGVKVG